MMIDPDVDVIIAVHDPRRQIERAVASALRSADARVRVTVVIHNTDPDPIVARLGDLARLPNVRLRELHDGVATPAGPFNVGLDAASGRFTSVMGSDDELAPGAIDAWLRLADEFGASVVAARLRFGGGGYIATPVARPRRGPLRNPLFDRLSYRSAPLGLVSRSEFGNLRLTEGVAVGEDVAYVTRLWFSDVRIAYDRRTPPYIVHSDADERTSLSTRPVADELAFVPLLLSDPWFQGLALRSRQAVIVKLLRVNLFGAVWNRRTPAAWIGGDREALSTVSSALVRDGAGIERVLSRRDRALLDAALDPRVADSSLCELAVLRRQFTRPSSLIPRSVREALHREAPLRFAAASAWQLL